MTILKSNQGLYILELGEKDVGGKVSPQRFKLGRRKEIAERRAEKILALWAATGSEWADTNLPEARRIASGQDEPFLAPDPVIMEYVRWDQRPGDIGKIIALHGAVYASEYGFDVTFETYVAKALIEVVERRSPRDRVWVAESAGQIVGSVAIVEAEHDLALLRWFLVAPGSRNRGLGKSLLGDAIEFAKESAYKRVMLCTVSALKSAAYLYRREGFKLVEERPLTRWGVDVVEERYELDLR